jgi:hypothetical protein
MLFNFSAVFEKNIHALQLLARVFASRDKTKKCCFNLSAAFVKYIHALKQLVGSFASRNHTKLVLNLQVRLGA